MNFRSAEEREAWVRFAAAEIASREEELRKEAAEQAAKVADCLLVEFRKRIDADEKEAAEEPF